MSIYQWRRDFAIVPSMRSLFSQTDLRRQRGNALWLLLIAIVLMGAVTMILSRSGSSVEQTGDYEYARVKALAVLRYAQGLEAAVQQLMINGCSENDISFENGAVAGLENTRNPSNEFCFVFSPKGAGQTWQSFSEADVFNGGDAVVLNDLAVEGVGTDGNAAENTDLLLLIETTQSICLQINRELGVSTDAAEITTKVADFTKAYQGDFNPPSLRIGDADSPALKGRMTGCVIGLGGEYLFYQVLMAR